MVTGTRQVSLSIDQNQFIDEKRLSPSRILRNAINELIEEEKTGIQQDKKELLRKVAAWKDNSDSLKTFIESHNLLDEWINSQIVHKE
jgi:hypothetical protein